MSRATEFFEKFEELGGVSAVARYFGVSRQNVHQYLDKMPEYQKYKRPKPSPPPPCPNCESDRTVNNGSEHGKKKYKCRACGYEWLEVSRIREQASQTIP